MAIVALFFAPAVAAQNADFHSQAHWSRDDVAAKNIFLAIRGAFGCERLVFVAARIREYAQENAVDTEALRKNEAGKYKVQWGYAARTVDDQVKASSLNSFCNNLLERFGPNGTTVAGLVTMTERSTSEIGDEAVNRIIQRGKAR
jgi:hypothetical protein